MTRRFTKTTNFLCFAALLVSLVFIGTADGQSGTTGVSGIVVDQTGSVVPGATVRLSNSEKGFSRSVTTNDSGRYNFASIAPATYRIEVEASGFKKLLNSNVHPSLTPSYLVAFALVAYGGIVQRVIEELAEQVQQLQLPVQFHGALGKTFTLDEGAHMFLGSGDGPVDVAIGHALLGARRAKLCVAPLHLGLGLVLQPVTQVAVDLAGAGLEFGRRDFVQITAPGRAPHLLAELAGKLFSVTLDKLHQSDGQHHSPQVLAKKMGAHSNNRAAPA